MYALYSVQRAVQVLWEANALPAPNDTILLRPASNISVYIFGISDFSDPTLMVSDRTILWLLLLSWPGAEMSYVASSVYLLHNKQGTT